jgi:hypothetical protein
MKHVILDKSHRWGQGRRFRDKPLKGDKGDRLSTNLGESCSLSVLSSQPFSEDYFLKSCFSISALLCNVSSGNKRNRSRILKFERQVAPVSSTGETTLKVQYIL